MAKKTDLKVTPVIDLKKYTDGEIVEWPRFSEGRRFIAKLKRPSMLVLMKSGKIPNSLLSVASSMFSGMPIDEKEEEYGVGRMLDVIEILAESSFVEPTWNEIKESGIELTDEQYIFIFNYTQRGIKAVTPSL